MSPGRGDGVSVYGAFAVGGVLIGLHPTAIFFHFSIFFRGERGRKFTMQSVPLSLLVVVRLESIVSSKSGNRLNFKRTGSATTSRIYY